MPEEPNLDSSLIWYHGTQPENYEPWTKQLDRFLEGEFFFRPLCCRLCIYEFALRMAERVAEPSQGWLRHLLTLDLTSAALFCTPLTSHWRKPTGMLQQKRMRMCQWCAHATDTISHLALAINVTDGKINLSRARSCSANFSDSLEKNVSLLVLFNDYWVFNRRNRLNPPLANL